MTYEEMNAPDEKTVSERRNEYKYSFYDDVTFVINTMTHHNVLIVGGKTQFVDLSKNVATTKHVQRLTELEQLLKNEQSFDRVLLHRDVVLSEKMISRCIYLSSGLVCFFSDQPTLRNVFREVVESCWLNANVWESNSNIGQVVLTDATGSPNWMD